jgi:hypothetical protein
MQPITLTPGAPVGLSRRGRTLSIVNDPLLVQLPVYDSNTALDLAGPDVETGTVLVGFVAGPITPRTADAIVPPFSSATIPVPPEVAIVYLLYPAVASPAAILPVLEDARTQIGPLSAGGGPIVVSAGWSDAEGPLGLWPTGGILGRRLGDFTHSIARLPLGYNMEIIPPSPATTVYDQDTAGSRGGPFFRPHIAPCGVAGNLLIPAATSTVYPATLATGGGEPDPFNPPATPLARCAVIHRISLSLYGVAFAAGQWVKVAIGTSNLMYNGGFPGPGQLVRAVFSANGSQTFDFGEGIATNFDGSSGQYQYYVDSTALFTGGAIDVQVLYG